MARALVLAVIGGALVMLPAAGFAAANTKPREIVVVGNQLKKSAAPKLKAKGPREGAKGQRRIIDCEGYASMTQNVMGGSCLAK